MYSVWIQNIFPNRRAWGIICLSEVSSGYRAVDTSRLPLHACLCMHDTHTHTHTHTHSDAALSIWWVAQQIQSTEAASQVEECCKVNCGQKKKKIFTTRPFRAIIRKRTYLPTTLPADHSSESAFFAFFKYIHTHLMSVCWISSSPRITCFECSGLSPVLLRQKVSASRGKQSNFRVNDLCVPRQSRRVILIHDIYFSLARLMRWIEKCAQIHSGFLHFRYEHLPPHLLITLNQTVFGRLSVLWSSVPWQKRGQFHWNCECQTQREFLTWISHLWPNSSVGHVTFKKYFSYFSQKVTELVTEFLK